MTLTAEIQTAIHQQSTGQLPALATLRRALHQHPEPSGHESWTAARLAEKLALLGLTVRQRMGGYGVVADLVTDPTAPTVALRVDMDALPIEETNPVSYRSQFPGLMHACGHDVHSAIGYGTATVLSALAKHLPGNVRFLFQPEEEEITGALRMIRAGALRDPVPAVIFGLHVAPLPVGQLAWSDGLFLSGFEHFLVTLFPRAGTPRTAAHLDAAAERCCRVIRGFNEWQLPETWAEMQAFWQLMEAGPHHLRRFTLYDASTYAENPAAWHGQFGIGIKAADQHLRRSAVGRVRAALNTVCEATHTHYRLEPMGAMLDLRNDPALVQAARPALEDALGAANLRQLRAAFPFNCEDFAYYTKVIPGAMFWLGAADPQQGKYALLHTPDFDVDEQCLQTGTLAMTTLIFDHLTRLAAR